jgi:hypothetical protein
MSMTTPGRRDRQPGAVAGETLGFVQAGAQEPARNPLRTDGFVRHSAEQMRQRIRASNFDADLDQIRRVFDTLPADAHAPGSNRRRRYARAIVAPWDLSLWWVPTVEDERHGDVHEYYQGRHNPEYPGSRRVFPAIPKELFDNEVFRGLVLDDLSQTLWLPEFEKSLIHVGIHFVKLVVHEEDAEAVSSPNVLHQDGEPFTFAHLIRRENVRGGVNYIAPPRCTGMLPSELREEVFCDSFLLKEPLDTYAVYDPLVCHYISPLRRGDEAGEAERSVVLVDFTPFVQQI